MIVAVIIVILIICLGCAAFLFQENLKKADSFDPTIDPLDLLKDGKIEEAESLYENLPAPDPVKQPGARADFDYHHGLFLRQLAQVKDSHDNLEQAAGLLQNAVILYGQRKQAEKQAEVYNELGEIYLTLADDPKEKEAYLSKALQVLTDASMILQEKKEDCDLAASVQYHLGYTYYALVPAQSNRPGDLGKAVTALTRAADYYVSHAEPLRHAMANLYIGACYLELYQIRNESDYLKNALNSTQIALKMINRKEDPANYALAHHIVGKIHLINAETGDKRRCFALAALHLQKTLRTDTPQSQSEDYVEIEMQLESIYRYFGESDHKAKRFFGALRHLEQIPKTEEPAGDNAFSWTICLEKGDIHLALAELTDPLNQLTLAFKAIEPIQSLDLKQVGSEIATRVAWESGRIHYQLSKLEDTWVNIGKAIRDWETALRLNHFSSSQERNLAQTNLRDALGQIEEVKPDSTNVGQLTQAYREIVKAYPPDDYPEEAAEAQVKLGDLLIQKAENEEPMQNFSEALEAYRSARSLFHSVPLLKNEADTAIKLGKVYLNLSKWDDALTNLEQAIATLKHAEELYGQIQEEHGQILARFILGWAYYRLSREPNQNQEIHLSHAIQLMQTSKDTEIPGITPDEYGSAMYYLGLAYLAFADIKEPRINLARATQHLKEAEQLITNPPYLVNQIRSDYATALIRSADFNGAADHLAKAIELLESILSSPAETDVEQGWILNDLAVCYQKIAEVSLIGKKDYLLKAVAVLEKAAAIFTNNEGYQIDYAMTMNNLGTTYSRLAGLSHLGDDSTKARQSLETALQIYSRGNFPDECRKVKRNLDQLLKY